MGILSQDQINNAIKLYNEGIHTKDIGVQIGIHHRSVDRLLKRLGVYKKTLFRITPEQTVQIVASYQQGISSEVIARNMDLDGSTVCRVLKRSGVALRPATENKRKYDIDQDYFKQIDSQEKAYFLGFLYADGNLSKRGYAIKIELHPQDRNILEKLSIIVYGFVKLGVDHREKEDYLYLAFYSKKIHGDLIKLGCMPDKSRKIAFPSFDIVPDHLMSHFIRGYMDGDGCISNANPDRPRLDISSNKAFILGLIAYLETKLGIKCNKPGSRDDKPDHSNIQFSSKATLKPVLDFIYQDATIYLDRKKQAFQELITLLDKKTSKKAIKFSDTAKYGTTYIPSYNGHILTGDYLKSLSPAEKEPINEFLFTFYRSNGFPYPILTDDEIIKEFTHLQKMDIKTILKEKDIIATNNQAGIAIFKHFAPHFYEVKSGYDLRKPSMLETFMDDEKLRKVIANRTHEKQSYNMTGNMLKQGLCNSKVAFKASIFFPTVAKAIYSKYTAAGDVVFDYSMGFGQRLLGAMAMPHPLTYVGVDPMRETVASNQAIFDFLQGHIPGLDRQADLICAGSEAYSDTKYAGKVKLAFSSPPYFNLEQYSNDDSQAYYDNNYSAFINDWWQKSVNNIERLLSDDGLLAINIKEEVDGFPLMKDMCNIIEKAGFVLLDSWKLQLTKNTAFKSRGEHKYEPILVFRGKR